MPYSKKKPSSFNPSMLRVQRKEYLNKEVKATEKTNPVMTKTLRDSIENMSEDKLKKQAQATVKKYISEAQGEGEFDFLKDEIDEEERISLSSDRAKFRKRQKLGHDKQSS